MRRFFLPFFDTPEKYCKLCMIILKRHANMVKWRGLICLQVFSIKLHLNGFNGLLKILKIPFNILTLQKKIFRIPLSSMLSHKHVS